MKFNDNKGREWELDINVAALRRVKDANIGVDLLNIEAGDPPLVTRLKMDLMLLIDVAWHVVRGQAELLQVDAREFGESLGGTAINSMESAFWKSLSDFFQSLGRHHLVKMIQAQTDLVTMAVKAAGEKVDAIDLQGLVDSASISTAGNTPTVSQVNAVLNLARTPSES